MMIYVRKAKTNLLHIHSGSITVQAKPLLKSLASEKFHHDMKFEKKDVFRDKHFDIYFAGPRFSLHLVTTC